MMQSLRNLSSTTFRTVENLLSNFDHRPVRAARWVLRLAADAIDPPRNTIPKPSEPPPPPPEPTTEPPPAIDGASLKTALAGQSAPLVLDVREPHETAGGVIP